MKLKRVFAVVLSVAMLTATGCTTRNNNSNVSTPPAASVPDVVPPVEREIDNVRSDIEEGVSRIQDELFDEDEFDSLPEGFEWDESLPENEASVPDTSIPDASIYEDESVAAAMSTDFNQIGALSAEKKGWGPGTNGDADNRPLGALDYQQKYGEHSAYFIAPNSNKIYLTFDEGYENNYSASILDTLKEKDVKAVFFITYPYAQTESDLVRRMVDEGHIIGNHSTKHLSFPDMPVEEAKEDIMKLHDYVKANYGYTMSLFRPPMGEFSEQTLALTKSLGYSSIFWSAAYKDWETDNQPISIEAMDTLIKRSHPGAIYLLHAVSSTNAEILGDFIDALRGKGFEFARFDWA